jgi:hypothetical protein
MLDPYYNLFVLTNLKCLDMERQFMSEWERQPTRNANVKLLSERIQERACYIIYMGREFSEPAAASLVVCIAQLKFAVPKCYLLIRNVHFLSELFYCEVDFSVSLRRPLWLWSCWDMEAKPPTRSSSYATTSASVRWTSCTLKGRIPKPPLLLWWYVCVVCTDLNLY